MKNTKNMKKKPSKREKKPVISHGNTMSPERIAALGGGEGAAIVEITEDVQPLWLFTGAFLAKPIFGAMSVSEGMNDLMVSILYDKKTKKVEVRGRTRFFGGRKSEITPHPMNGTAYDPLRVDMTKASVRELFKYIGKYATLEKPQELSFPIGASNVEVIQAMNDSNLFDIGVVKKQK